MSFSPGVRVVLLQAHAGIPAGSLGTVVDGTEVTTLVDFDVDPSRSVIVPNTLLAPAAAGIAAAKQVVMTSAGAKGGTKHGGGGDLFWHTPKVVKPGVGTAANFVAVTATPNVLSLLLEGAEVALRRAAPSGCWIGSLQFPFVGSASNLSVDVRGSATQGKGAKTTIIVVIGAVLQSIAFDDEHSGDFTKTYSATIGDEPVQTITVILLAERPAGSDDLLLTVDSIDVARV